MAYGYSNYDPSGGHKKYLCDGCHCLFEAPLTIIKGGSYCNDCTDPCEDCVGTGTIQRDPINGFRYAPCLTCNRTGRVLPNPIDKHPGYPTQNDFSDLDSPRLFSPMMKVLDPECYGIMRMETARWRALVKIEWERDRIALRLAVLQDRADELTWLVTSETVEYTQLANQLIELDKDHAGLVAEDAIEPGYNFKALED